MANEAREKHLLAGLDERARGFTRMVSVEPQAEAFRASLQYEAHVVVSADADSPSVALADLARRLHERGYTQLRRRLTLAGGTYLGSQEQRVGRAPGRGYGAFRPPAPQRRTRRSRCASRTCHRRSSSCAQRWPGAARSPSGTSPALCGSRAVRLPAAWSR